MSRIAAAISLFRKFLAHSWGERAVLLEALLAITAASLLIACLPFKRVVRCAGWPPVGNRLPGGEARVIIRKQVRWAIVTVAQRLPWPALCFQQGLAAQWMLRRRGLPSRLYYGASHDANGGLRAHVWVKDEDADVVGGEMASQFALLAVFP